MPRGVWLWKQSVSFKIISQGNKEDRSMDIGTIDREQTEDAWKPKNSQSQILEDVPFDREVKGMLIEGPLKDVTNKVNQVKNENVTMKWVSDWLIL